jgi:hypothetical protein
LLPVFRRKRECTSRADRDELTAAISSWSSGAGAPRSRPWLRGIAVSSSYHAALYVRGAEHANRPLKRERAEC